MMSIGTRTRAVIVSGIATSLAVVGLLDERLLGLKDLAENAGFDFSEKTYNVIYAGFISFVLAVSVYWVLYFKRKGISSVIAIVLFPSFASYPYFLLASRVGDPLNSQFSLTLSIFLIGLVYWLVTYLLILTSNVLNGAVLFNIPLGQAGKATQFIFSLVAVYLVEGYLVTIGFTMWFMVLFLAGFITYLTYSNVWVLQLPQQQTLLTTMLISVLMLGLITLLLIWPVNVVYFTLVSTIGYYILLNVAIEVRSYVDRMIWIEYVLLVLLCLFLLAINVRWGIQGSLF